jgi:hypothetical protein
VVLLFGAVGICVDLQRDFQAAAELSFAAQTAAIYGLSMSTNADGSYTLAGAENNISAAVQSAYASANSAQSGPQSNSNNSSWSAPVVFAQTDVNFVQNPNPSDTNDLFVQLTASRSNENALKQFFLPLLSTTLTGSANANLPLSQINSKQIVEVIAQPATRIGAGSLSPTAGSRAAELALFATFPLAISNQQFAQIANNSQTGSNYTIDLVNSSTVGNTAAPGHLKGAFVNLAMADAQTYAAAQGDVAINQLEGLLSYYHAFSLEQTLAPAMVETGSQLNAFNSADFAFSNRQAEINQVVSSVPSNRYYIIPVIANDPSFGTSNQVVGFARLLISGAAIINKGQVVGIPVQLGESIPVRNAVAAAGISSFDPTGQSFLPAPVFPFQPRQLDTVSGGITARNRGVVMAPCPSPRQIKAST